jgi:hypothetical protein
MENKISSEEIAQYERTDDVDVLELVLRRKKASLRQINKDIAKTPAIYARALRHLANARELAKSYITELERIIAAKKAARAEKEAVKVQQSPAPQLKSATAETWEGDGRKLKSPRHTIPALVHD